MLHHVAFSVPTGALEACVAFYAELGFEPVPAPPGIAERATWLERGPTQLHLMRSNDEGTGPRTGHFAIVADDYDATVAALAAHGHEAEPRREHWGAPRSFVRDPAGNVVELMTAPPAPRGGARDVSAG